jgi:hypothetical protein
MSIAKKSAHKAEAVKGSVKLTAGRLTGSRRLRAEAAVTRSRTTSNRPAPRSRTQPGTDHPGPPGPTTGPKGQRETRRKGFSRRKLPGSTDLSVAHARYVTE